MKHTLLHILITGMGLLAGTAAAQTGTRTVSGLITASDGGSPLEGVAVYVKGKNYLSGSQYDGVFYISVTPKDSILVFVHEDFQTAEKPITASSEYNVALKKKSAARPFPPSGWQGSFQLHSDPEKITGNQGAGVLRKKEVTGTPVPVTAPWVSTPGQHLLNSK
jgi:hypothetical protein